MEKNSSNQYCIGFYKKVDTGFGVALHHNCYGCNKLQQNGSSKSNQENTEQCEAKNS